MRTEKRAQCIVTTRIVVVDERDTLAIVGTVKKMIAHALRFGLLLIDAA
jgi:hypothetical protein